MDLLLLLPLGALIGLVLGGLGGGGAILTVPALVYVVGQGTTAATTSSLVIVGATAAAGALAHRHDGIRWRAAAALALIGLPATWLGSLLSPRIDDQVLMLCFAAVMVAAATVMLAGSPTEADRAEEPRTAAVVVVALVVGLMTGVLGVGGGFVVVPALVLALRIPMREAVGTSLVVVAASSTVALTARVATTGVDWSVTLPFALAAVVATPLGHCVAERLPERTLRTGFAVLMVLVAGYVGWQSLTGLSAPDTALSPSRACAPATAAPAPCPAPSARG